MFKRSMIKFCSGLLAFLMAIISPLNMAQGMKGTSSKARESEKSTAVKLTEEQRAIHLLDRAAFGPRPGDIERVMKMGWQKYLDEQLRPDRLADALVEQKLKPLESIHLNNSELAKSYPPPQVIREVLKSKGIDVSGLQNQNNNNPQQPGNAPQFNAEDIKKRREVRQALAEMGFKPQQQIVQELQQSKILRAIYSERQLQEVMTDFWYNHFNVYIQKGADRVLTTAYERDVIRPRVFGKFADLLRATAESPAMLFYLDNWMSRAPDASNARAGARAGNRDEMRRMRREQQELRRSGKAKVGAFDPALDPPAFEPKDRPQDRNTQMQPDMLNKNGKIPKKRANGLNENYAREIMELHTLGVDGGYTQKDVQEVARCFTGWTIRNPRGGGEFYFNPFFHDDGEKIILGKKIAPGGGMKDGEIAIKMLAHHPSTAKFISTKLARKFVSDNPPRALVDRMTQTFLKTDGEIAEVLRTMFNSPEFWAPENYRAKIKTPFEMTVSAVRAIGAETNGSPAFHRWIAQMGEGLFMAQPPTGYPDTSEHWVNTGALLERMNFALALSANKIPGTRVNLNPLSPGTATSQPVQLPVQLIDRYAKILLNGGLSPQSRATIEKTLSRSQEGGTNDTPANVDVAKVVGLILGSPEFQRQ